MCNLKSYYGLRWRNIYLGIICIALAVLGLVLTTRAIEEMEYANSISQQFMDFLNGGTIVSADGKFAARCENLIEVVNEK